MINKMRVLEFFLRVKQLKSLLSTCSQSSIVQSLSVTSLADLKMYSAILAVLPAQ